MANRAEECRLRAEHVSKPPSLQLILLSSTPSWRVSGGQMAAQAEELEQRRAEKLERLERLEQ